MTVIAAVAGVVRSGEAGSVFMGADHGSFMDGQISHSLDKVTRLTLGAGDDALVGIAGSAAMGTIVRRSLDLSAIREAAAAVPGLTAEDDAYDAVVDMFADALCQAAVAAVPPVTDQSGAVEAGVLFGWRGRLWVIGQQNAGRVPHDIAPDGLGLAIAGIGTGGDLAHGYLLAVQEHAPDGFPAYTAVAGAIQTACDYSPFCCLAPGLDPLVLVAGAEEVR